MSNSNSGSNSHNKPNHQSNPPLMKSQLNTANGSVAEPGHKSRCYLCDTPKPEYSLTRSFSEPICRGCLNYEGPDRVEQLIAEARRFKTRQASPPSGGAPISGCSFNSPANNNIDTNNNQNNNNINHVYKTHAQPPPASHVGAKLDSLKTTLQSHNYHPIAGDKQAGGLPVSAGILGDAGSGGDKLRSMIAATDGRGAVKAIDGPIARKRDRPLTSRSPSPSTTLIWENHNGGTKHQQQHDMSIHHHSQAAPGARGGGTTHPPLPAELLRAASSKIEQRTHKTNTTTTTTSTTTNRDEPFSGGDTRFTHTPPIATGPAIKNPLSYPDCCKQGGPPADQRYTGAAEPATGQLSANQESVSSRGFRFEQTSSSPNALDGHQQQAAPVAQHQLSASAAAAQKGAAQQAHHTTSSGSMGHSKQLDGRIPRTKTSVTPTKSTPSSVGPSYQHHQQSHMLEAALDPYQAMMRAAAPLHPAVCSPADQLLRMHQQQFQLEDPAMFARELARLQSGGGAGGLLMGGSEDARQPKLGPFDDGTQPAPLHAHQAADDSVKSSVDSLHRLVQDPNALGLPGLSMYAADPALACALPPSYYAPRSPPLPLIGQQQTTEDSGRHSDTGAARNTGKQAAQAAARAAQAAISSSLYGHYPIAMAPYMTPNGPLFCATQYHPYHFHHHTASFQSSAYNNLLAPPVGGLVSTTGSHLGPGPGAQLGTAAAGSTAGLPAPVPTDKLGGMGAYGPLVSSNGSGSDNQPPDYNLRRMLTGEASGDNQLNSAACQQQQQQLQTTKTHSEPRSAMEPVAAPDNKDSRPVTPVKGDRGLVGKLATRCCVSADNKLERGAEKLKQSADSNRCISDMEDSSSSNMLVILDRDSDHKEHHTVDQQQQPQQMTTRGRKPIRTPDEVTGDVSSPQAKQRSDPSFHRASPPPAKRVPLGFTKGKPLLSSKSDRDGCAPMDRSNSNETVSPYGDSFDAANSRSPTLMGSGGGGAKPKSLATTFKQHVTRRSQVASGESALEVDNSNKLNLNSEPDVEVERELRHSGRKGAASDASNMNNTSLPKNAQDPTAAGAGSGASGTSHRSSQTNSHHSLKGRHASAQNNNNSSNNNNSNKAPPVYQNENSSDRSYPKRPSAEEQAPVSISSTTSHSSSRKSSHQMKQQQQQLQQQQQKQQQQQQHQQLIPPHQYSPLKCSTCRERLEDRHFVQCPSVMAHKFCFACSKVAIERQQLENKKLGNGFDRVFCPSGNRCFLATEHTPWTFMNSEIETIFRESSRQSSSASSEANSHGARSNSNSSSEIINSNNNNHQQQQQQNGHHDKSSSSHDDASDPIQRSVSLLSPGSVASIQKKYNEADSGVAEVCSTGAQTGKVS